MQVSEIKAYLDLAGIEDVDERMKFMRLMQAMDSVERSVLTKLMNKGK